MSRLRLVTPLCTALLLAPACKHPSTRLDLEKIDAQDDAKPTGGETATKVDPLPVERATDLLPNDVPLLAEANDPGQVLQLFASLTPMPELEQMRSELAGTLGGDPLKAEDWAKLGLDVHRSAGVALLDLRGEAFCAWVSLADPKVFDQTLRRVASTTGMDRELLVGDMNGAVVYRFSDDFNVVVRAGVAAFVMVDKPQEAKRDYPASFATIDPRDSLGRAPAYQWAQKQLRAGDDGLVLMAPNAIFEAFVADGAEEVDYGVQYAEQSLADAKRSGADAAAIRELEQRLEQERQWASERKREREAGQALARELISPMQAFMMSGNVEPTRLDGQARLLMPSGGLLRDIFVPASSPSPLTTALDEPPLVMLDGQTDVDQFMRLVDMLAKADGESLDKLDQEARGELGFSPLAAAKMFDGRAGFALTRSKAPNPKKLDELEKTLGLALYFGLKDADGLRQILDALARFPAAAEEFKTRKGGWELVLKDWRNLLVEIVDQRLVISTDKNFASHVRNAKSGKQALAASHPFNGGSPGAALRGYMDWSWLPIANPPYSYIQTIDNLLYDLDVHPQLSREEAAKVPQSKADKQLRKDLSAVLKELEGLERLRAEREFNESIKLANEFGEFSMQVEVVSDGLAASAVWQTRNKRGFLDIAIGMVTTGRLGLDDENMRINELNQKAWDLASQIRTQRMLDLDAHVASKKPAQ